MKPGPLGAFVHGYPVWLLARGYSPSVAVRSLITLGHLGRWMEREALTVDQLTDERVTAFLADYRSDHGRLPSSSVGRCLSTCAPTASFRPRRRGW